MIKNKLMNETKFPADDGSGSQQCSFISSVLFYNKSDLDELCLTFFCFSSISKMISCCN